MPVDPELQVILDEMLAAGFSDTEAMSADAMREMLAAMPAPPPLPDLPKVEQREVPGAGGEIPVIVYTPQGSGPFPLLVYYHGGGWVLGSATLSDAFCRTFAHETGSVVVNVDYRLAPEHPFPAAIDDCYAATNWAVASANTLNADADRVVVMGESAGANLAAAVALRARDRGGPTISLQVLACPVTDYTLEQHSYIENGDGYLLTTSLMTWFWNHYVPDERDRGHPEAAPLRARSLSGLPPAYIVTAGYDPLRDEGEAYAQRLEREGVTVIHRHYESAIHAFFNQFYCAPTAIGLSAQREMVEAIRAVTS